ncbi:hypothetical protein WOLCODRAFT_147251 [Wolfiporia cocos MD-104 SS10]|uniref:Uncharacterized protein n=1 Tax=Wolfiporia cocos (strain MD-104) TaxID=742152 RepID=A0A2H3IUP3_WOLCO|nr:hypothetical protein WOLCODRAFT_147251 [Wolfiporia cocos MD-104 SS10]
MEKTRQPHHRHRTAAVHTRTPPDPSGSDKAIPANGRASAEGHTARATARVIQHSRKPQPPAPPAYKCKGGQRRIIAKATRRAPSRTAAPPLYQTRHPFCRPRPNRTRSRHAARQQGSPGGGHYENTPLATASPGKAYQRQGNATAAPVHSDNAHGRLHQTHKAPPPSGVPGASAAVRRQTPSTLPRYSQGAGGDILSPPSISQRVRERRPTLKAKDSPPTAIDPPGQRRRHRLSSKGSGQGNKSSKGQKQGKKRINAPMGAARARRARPATYTTPRVVRSLRTPLRHRPSRYKQQPRKA